MRIFSCSWISLWSYYAQLNYYYRQPVLLARTGVLVGIIAPGHEYLRVGGLGTCSIKQPVITAENKIVAFKCFSGLQLFLTSKLILINILCNIEVLVCSLPFFFVS